MGIFIDGDALGWTPLAPGVWDDGTEVHVDMPAVCVALGFEPTDENQERLARELQEYCGEQGVGYTESREA